MLDAAPGQLADMHQTVDATDIDEGAEVHDLTYHALVDLANFQRGQQLLCGLLLVPSPKPRGG